MCERMRLVFLVVLASGALFGQGDVQTQVFTEARAARLGDVHYKLFFDLKKDQQTYGGKVTIDMAVRSGDADITVDFVGEAVTGIEVNANPVNDFLFSPDSGRITIPAKHFETGPQTLTIDFTGRFSNDGSGFHRFVDPEDGLEYHYTDFQPYHAHHLSPCFDQPDLKASYRVQVLAPNDWEVISNTAVMEKRRRDGRTHWSFKPSVAFSTYLFHLSAGAYAVWRDHEFRIPLALYARQSQADYVDPDGFFDVTRRGFDFFEAYFDIPYPFGKYDQLFVPEFNAGAMENVGAVTFREGFLTYRQPPSQRFLSNRAMVILHELAHMWFGNLVTMKWWNDLWLNESFATYISYVAMEDLGFADPWISAARFKHSAMVADQRVTTHPILTEVPDTVAANSIFDAITYGKGLAVLRQLDYYLDGTEFRDGLREYFKRHAWKNTTLNDFLSALQSVTDKPLTPWSEQWLRQADINKIQLSFQERDGRITQAEVRQWPGASNDIVRTHAVDIGLFYTQADGLVMPSERVKVTFSGARQELPELIGKPVPQLVLPNISDYGYMKIAFDDQSRDWILGNLEKVGDKQSKAMIWSILWDMVRDSNLSARSYIDLGLKQAEAETDIQILQTMLGNMRVANSNFLPDAAEQKRFSNAFYLLAERAIKAQEPGSDLQSTWYNMLYNSAFFSGRMNILADLFEGNLTYEGLNIDHRRKWTLLHWLVSGGHPKAAEYVQSLAEADTSAYGRNFHLYLSSLQPDAEAKEVAWQKVFSGEGLSRQEIRWIGMGIHDRNHPQLSLPFVQRFFDDLQQVHQRGGYHSSSLFNGLLFPDLGYEKTVEAAERFLKRPGLDPNLAKMVEEKLDDLKREIKIREFSKRGGRS